MTPAALKDVVVDALVIVSDGVPIVIDVVAVLLVRLPSFVAPVVPLTVLVPADVRVPVTEQFIVAPAATDAGGAGVQDVVRPAGRPATEHAAAVAVAVAADEFVQVNVPLYG